MMARIAEEPWTPNGCRFYMCSYFHNRYGAEGHNIVCLFVKRGTEEDLRVKLFL
jgi:hypothetical protein